METMPSYNDPKEVTRIGQAIYEERIRDTVEADNSGRFLVLDILSCDYEIDSDEIAAFDRSISRHPDGVRFLIRIGEPTAHFMGGSSVRIAQ